MARQPRLEFEGAIYHVISRGNYRKNIFDAGSAKAFEKALFEACSKCGWRLHAYVIMSNHYHLALETPGANLVEGMKWLQGTFANRFNAFRGERGHVFQSRYKSILIEEGRSLLGLVNYIHLNPVRAGLMPLSNLAQHVWSSYPKFFHGKVKAPLVREVFLSELRFPDNARGMRQYAKYLECCEEGDPQRRDEMSRRYSRGWAVAGEEFRRQLSETLREGLKTEVAGREFADLKENIWEGALSELLMGEKKTMKDAEAEPKSADWKVRVAGALRATTTATNAWIAARLCMGHPSRVRNLIREKL